MDPVDWVAVAAAALIPAIVALAWYGWLFGRRALAPRWIAGAVVVQLAPALMLGHALARIGSEKLAAKPWLYWMQSGGIALAFVIPALATGYARLGTPRRELAADAGFWLVVYLLTGTVFRLAA